MNRRSLRHITRQRLGKNDISGVSAELRAMDDRPAAIVAATLVEDALEDYILKYRMAKLTKAEYEYLFQGNGPLTRFADKIRIAHTVKLIYRSSARQIQIIKDVRNVFAHARIPVYFDTPEIIDYVNRITEVERHRDQVIQEIWKGSNHPLHQIASSVRLHDPRSRYLGSCLYFSYMLWDIPPPDPDDWDEEEDDT